MAGLRKAGRGKTLFVRLRRIMTNPRKTVLYTGVTNNLPRRVYEHPRFFSLSRHTETRGSGRVRQVPSPADGGRDRSPAQWKDPDEHKEKLAPGFASRYNVTDLVYYEMAETAEAAIAREKQLKGGSRQRKPEFIKSMNPNWRDLSTEL